MGWRRGAIDSFDRIDAGVKVKVVKFALDSGNLFKIPSEVVVGILN